MSEPEMLKNEEKPTEEPYRSWWWLIGAVLTYDISWFVCGYCMSYFNSLEFNKIYELYEIPL